MCVIWKVGVEVEMHCVMNTARTMLQHLASEGEFYTGCLILFSATSLSRLRLRFARGPTGPG